MKDQQHEITIT